MAETITKQAAKANEPKMVDIFIPYIDGEDEFEHIGINGKMYLVKRGERVQVPEPVRKVWENSQRDIETARRNREMFKDQRLSD